MPSTIIPSTIMPSTVFSHELKTRNRINKKLKCLSGDILNVLCNVFNYLSTPLYSYYTQHALDNPTARNHKRSSGQVIVAGRQMGNGDWSCHFKNSDSTSASLVLQYAEEYHLAENLRYLHIRAVAVLKWVGS